MYSLIYTKRAQKDAIKIKHANLKDSVQKLLAIIEKSPWTTHPPYEKLIGDLTGCYSRRINIQHRLVYEVFEEQKIVKILAMWSHYE